MASSERKNIHDELDELLSDDQPDKALPLQDGQEGVKPKKKRKRNKKKKGAKAEGMNEDGNLAGDGFLGGGGATRREEIALDTTPLKYKLGESL